MIRVSVKAKRANRNALKAAIEGVVREVAETTARKTAYDAGPLILNAFASGALALRPTQTGNLPLYDEGLYASSWSGRAEGTTIVVEPTGMNRDITNEQLSLYLELGTRRLQALPHIGQLHALVTAKAQENLQRQVRDVRSR